MATQTLSVGDRVKRLRGGSKTGAAVRIVREVPQQVVQVSWERVAPPFRSAHDHTRGPVTAGSRSVRASHRRIRMELTATERPVTLRTPGCDQPRLGERGWRANGPEVKVATTTSSDLLPNSARQMAALVRSSPTFVPGRRPSSAWFHITSDDAVPALGLLRGLTTCNASPLPSAVPLGSYSVGKSGGLRTAKAASGNR
jgi:hypothetical protein